MRNGMQMIIEVIARTKMRWGKLRNEMVTRWKWRVHHSLNFHSCRHMGHCWFTCWLLSHFMMQWMWKQWEHCPHTRGQSSPGSLQSGQQLSKAMRQMPQLSSLATHFHTATPVQFFISTFMPGCFKIYGTVPKISLQCVQQIMCHLWT